MRTPMLQQLVGQLQTAQGWYMYGAGIVAFNVALALEDCFRLRPVKILVTGKRKKDPFFDGEQVSEWKDEYAGLDKGLPILIMTPAVYHREIAQQLEREGFYNYILPGHRLEYEIMAAYFEKNGYLTTVDSLLEHEVYKNAAADVEVYMAKSHKDTSLRESRELYDYIVPVQAGAEIADKDMGIRQDNSGRNISVRNACYCELTVTYWAWKNTHHRYKGICHYRRMLVLSGEQITMLENCGVDVVLPLPYVCRYSTRDQSGRYVSDEDYQAMLCALKEVYPEDYEDAVAILQGRYLYNYNMLIARDEVFDAYCKWMFDILERAQCYCDKEGRRQDRYAGYLGELLTSIYFIKNQDRLKIAHADRIWMV